MAETADVSGERHDDGETILSGPRFFRLADMLERLRDELHRAPLDDAARARLRDLLNGALSEFREVFSPDLVAELGRLEQPLRDGIPSEPELRVAYTELIGWLEGMVGAVRLAVRAQGVSPDGQARGDG